MDGRVHTIEGIVGVPVRSGGLFRHRYVMPEDVYPGNTARFVALTRIIGWIFRRSRSSIPNYVVLAASDDTCFVFASAVALGAVGPEIIRSPIRALGAVRHGSWDLDLTFDTTRLELTCVSCDRASLALLETLAPG